MSWFGHTVGQFFGSWFGQTQTTEPPGGGTSAAGGGGSKRRRRRVVQYSDLEARQELEIAAMAVHPPPIAVAPVKIHDDEEIITLMLLTA